MSYNIGPKIGIDGEKEFRQQLRALNDEYKALEAETKMVAAQYEAMGDQQGKLEAEGEQLNKLIDNQKKKMAALEEAVDKASQKFDESAKKLDELKKELETARFEGRAADVAALEKAVAKATKEFDDSSNGVTRLKGALYDTKTTIAQLEGQLSSATKELDKMASGLDDVEEELDDVDGFSFGDLVGADLVSDAIGTIAEGIAQAAEESREYRKIMASLEQSSKKAGYTAQETSKSYGKLNGVLGDTQAAATTTANLQALELEQNKLREITDGCIGSWAKYGDSIPIDGLSEAVNHTAQLGEVQGTLADVIEWGGGTVEEFNKQLAACADKTERADLIARLFAEQGLTRMGQAWQEQNRSLVEANQAADAMQAQLARLGETVEPAMNAVTAAAARMFAVINDGLEELTRQTAGEELAAGLDDVRFALSKASAATYQNAAETESAVFMAEHYIRSLEEMERAGLNTEESQAKYAATIAALGDLMPELNLEVDQQTGLLKKSTYALLEDVEAWEQRAAAQALQAQLAAQIQAEADAREALRTAQQRQQELEASIVSVTTKLTEAQAKNTGQTSRWAAALNTANAAASGMTGDLSALGNQAMGITPEIAALEKELAALQSEQAGLSEEMTQANGVIAQAEAEIEATKDALEGYAGAMADAAAAQEEAAPAQEKANERFDTTLQRVQELTGEYTSAKNAALESIQSQIGLFEKLDMKSDYTAKKVVENWKAQQKAINDYNANLQKAVSMGLAPELVEQLSDGSVESMKILAALVDSSEVSVEEINDAFGDRLEADNALSETVAQMETEFTRQMQALAEEAKKAGVGIVEGMVSGMESQKDLFRNAVGDVFGVDLTGLDDDVTPPEKPPLPRHDEVILDAATAQEFAAHVLAANAVPAMMPGSAGSHSTVTYGDTNITIYQQPGEDAEDLVDRVMDAMQTELEKRGNAIG